MEELTNKSGRECKELPVFRSETAIPSEKNK